MLRGHSVRVGQGKANTFLFGAVFVSITRVGFNLKPLESVDSEYAHLEWKKQNKNLSYIYSRELLLGIYNLL